MADVDGSDPYAVSLPSLHNLPVSSPNCPEVINLFDIPTNEPRHEKTCLRDFRPGKTQTGLLSYRDQVSLEIWDLV